MSNSTTLSAIPFFGGKERMAKELCQLLNYKDTDIYLELFGGGCRTLLNKPRHAFEFYNDSSAGLVALMECLSKPETGIQLIKLLYKTKYDNEEFDRALDFRNEFEDCYYDETVRRLKVYIKHLKNEYHTDGFGSLLISKIKEVETIREDDFKQTVKDVQLNRREIELLYRYIQNYQFIMGIFRPAYCEAIKEICVYLVDRAIDNIDHEIQNVNDHDKNFINKLELVKKKILHPDDVKNYKYVIDALLSEAKKRAITVASNEVVNRRDGDIDRVKLAVATFIIYSQSRDGAGVVWSDSVYKNDQSYYRSIDRLYDVMKRLNGVQVTQADAMTYLRDFGNKHNFINNPRVMMYLDPSYLQEGSTQHKKKEKLTDRDKILNIVKERKSKNVGFVYKQSWDMDEHEEFLHLIRDAKCHILLSNYDDESGLYKRILVEENPDKNRWKRIEFETTTRVGSKNDNKRTEVVWYNY